MFGQGKFQNGVLIEPKPEYKFDSQDAKKLEEFRNKIWYRIWSACQSHRAPESFNHRASVERANQFAPSHSRIFKEVNTT